MQTLPGLQAGGTLALKALPLQTRDFSLRTPSCPRLFPLPHHLKAHIQSLHMMPVLVLAAEGRGESVQTTKKKQSYPNP